jgi:hypothetical protein
MPDGNGEEHGARAYATTIQELERSLFIPTYRIEGTPVYAADGKHA